MDTDALATVEAAGPGPVLGKVESITDRQCAIEIENGCTTYTFANPRMYIYTGNCASPLPPTVAPGATGKALFTKFETTTTGCVGVVLYDLLNGDEKQATEEIAVMFSVPFDFNVFQNWYAVGVFDLNTQCDEALYNLMYYGHDTRFSRQKASGPPLTYVGGNITIKGTMSDSYQPVIKVQVSQNKK